MKQQLIVPIIYDDHLMETKLVVDLLVNDTVVVEQSNRRNSIQYMKLNY